MDNQISELISHVVDTEWNEVYKEEPRRYDTLQDVFAAHNHYSKTYKKSFIIAHECYEEYISDGEIKVREIEYYAFHDIYHYIYNMREFNHAHEIVDDYNNDPEETNGRIVFDFDIDKKEIKDIDMFKKDMDKMVKDVLVEFYNKITNISTVSSIWMTSLHEDKYSMHVTYTGVFFLFKWVREIKIFYQLCELVIARNNLFSTCITTETRLRLINKNIAKHYTTLRIPFSSKLGGNPLLIEDWKGTDSFFNAFIQNHTMYFLYEPFTDKLINVNIKYLLHMNRNTHNSIMKDCLKKVLIELGMIND